MENWIKELDDVDIVVFMRGVFLPLDVANITNVPKVSEMMMQLITDNNTTSPEPDTPSELVPEIIQYPNSVISALLAAIDIVIDHHDSPYVRAWFRSLNEELIASLEGEDYAIYQRWYNDHSLDGHVDIDDIDDVDDMDYVDEYVETSKEHDDNSNTERQWYGGHFSIGSPYNESAVVVDKEEFERGLKEEEEDDATTV